MTAEQFAYWLQGYAELNEAPPTAEQWALIREHLALVFNKVTSAPHWFDQPYFINPPLRVEPTITCATPGDDLRTRTVC